MKTAHDLVTEARAHVAEVAIGDADAAIRDAAIRDADVLIDVREADEYAAGHIAGAVHMSRGMLEFKLSNDTAFSSRDMKMGFKVQWNGKPG
ncbi:rhodanese-like domain-containing protein [Massilia sp. DJPM01]|uniref:rhodanese-like domain-containing protein n=1 Tax=Massilia sp. DJPM01 TaxID=3024404 RepID=UPI002805AF22|nr:rhodanese-like domain-containing protein [Massilia sp. DJPM01]